MKTEKILLATTILAAAALSRFRLVNFAGAPAGAGDATLGVANTNYALGEQAGVATHGEILVEAGGVIPVGSPIEPDAQGRAVAVTTGKPWGNARDAATAAGDIIRVLR